MTGDDAACHGGSSRSITAIKLDTSRYFSDPKVAAFVSDVQDGNPKRVTEALKAGMSPNVTGKDGFRPLFFVFPARNAEVTQALLAAGADPNVRLTDGSTPLYFSVRLENAEFTKALLGAKADPNARVENEKPIIHEAVRSGNPEQLKLLANSGADINVVWGAGTPLYAAVSALSFDVARTLLEWGADTQWRSAGRVNKFTAGEYLCNMLTRPNYPIRLAPTAYPAISELFSAFSRRGVVLPCAAEATRYH